MARQTKRRPPWRARPWWLYALAAAALLALTVVLALTVFRGGSSGGKPNREQGIQVERVLTDNAKAYHARAWIDSTARLQLERRYTRPYRPRTNGKAERFIQTLLSEWAYARSYPSSSTRARALPGYLRWYNRRRPHSSLGARPPISRVSHLCGHDS
jgi:transposase InsO family protein